MKAYRWTIGFMIYPSKAVHKLWNHFWVSLTTWPASSYLCQRIVKRRMPWSTRSRCQRERADTRGTSTPGSTGDKWWTNAMKRKKHCNMLCSPIPGWAAQTPGMLAFVCFFPWLQQNALEQGSNIIINQLWMYFRSFNGKVAIIRGKCFPFEISYFWLIRHYSAFLARACVEDELRSVLQGKAAVNAASLVRHSTRKAQTQSKNATSREGKGL